MNCWHECMPFPILMSHTQYFEERIYIRASSYELKSMCEGVCVTHTHTYIHTYTYIYILKDISACVRVSMYVYIYTYIYIYI